MPHRPKSKQYSYCFPSDPGELHRFCLAVLQHCSTGVSSNNPSINMGTDKNQNQNQTSELEQPCGVAVAAQLEALFTPACASEGGDGSGSGRGCGSHCSNDGRSSDCSPANTNTMGSAGQTQLYFLAPIVEKMQAAAQLLVGTHDFAGFQSKGGYVRWGVERGVVSGQWVG